MRTILTAILVFALLMPFSVWGQQKDQNPGISLHQAALQGNLDAVQKHIEAGTDLNQKDQYGSTPLTLAATFGKTEVANALIDAGVDMEISDNYGSTPLIIATLLGRTEIVKALLDNGVNKYTINNSGATALDIASTPFEYDKKIYDQLGAALGPLGLKLDYDQIKSARTEIATMLRPRPEELAAVDYKPIPRIDWKISTPEAQGLNPMIVAELYNEAAHLKTIYGVLVIKNGRLIAEGYFNKGSIEQLSKRASVTKSYVSALVGLALKERCISSVDQKMIDFFPEVADQITDQRKKNITIRQMLQMRAGYPWEETDSVYWNTIWSGRYIHPIVDIPLTADPGTRFHYSNLTSDWLGIIVARACNNDLKTFGQKHLFGPLGVTLGNWTRDLNGYYIGSGDIEFTARDLAKFGVLYLNDGKYDGKQLVPASWVKASLQNYSDDITGAGIKEGRVGRYLYDIGYGYQWWNAKAGEHHFEYAWGHGGQFIALLKDLDMVIVITADPFYGKEEHFRAWKYEQAHLNLMGKFIKSLPTK